MGGSGTSWEHGLVISRGHRRTGVRLRDVAAGKDRGQDGATLEAVDKLAADMGSRSQVVETALREFLGRRKRARRDARDLGILNRDAATLNREMADVLDYQAES